MRLVLVISVTAVAVAAGLAGAQPKKPDPKTPTPTAGSGSAARPTGAGSGARPGTPVPGAGSGAKPGTPGTGAGSAAKPGTPGTGAGSGTKPGGTPVTGAGSGSAAKPPGDTLTPVGDEPKPDSDEPDVDSLRQEYLKLRDELFESRARAATVASQLYSTKVSVRLTYTSGRMYGVSRASIRLDGAGVYDNTSGAIALDDGIRFEGYIAPGRHVVGFRIEASGKDDPRFTTAAETTLVVQAVAGKDLMIAAKASDGGDIAYAWKKKEAGTYRLGLDVDVKSLTRPTEKKAASAAGRSSDATASR